MRRTIVAGLLLLLLALSFGAGAQPARADDPAASAWLEDASITWNEPGAEIPPPPEGMAAPAYCASFIRPAETDADRQVEAAGWRLVTGYEAGWGVAIVRAAAGFDANCRFSPFAAFVFVDGRYAGSLSPHPAWPRADGALQSAALGAKGEIVAVYERYGPDTPRCCPLETVRVTFAVERGPDGPVVQPSGERLRIGPDGVPIPESGGGPAATPAAS